MIEYVLDWIENVNLKFDIKPQRVLDVGSKDHNKKLGARHLFPDSEYIGIDIAEGSNVDIIIDAYRLSNHFSPKKFDAVLCVHLLEHLARPWVVLEQIYRVLCPEGYLYLSVPTFGYPKHNYPGDYWRATHEAVSEVFMDGYDILTISNGATTFGKHPIINCLGVKNEEHN